MKHQDEPDRNRRLREDFEKSVNQHGLAPDEVASFCVGVVLKLCVDAGEDPKFIARRMVIFASEDIGMAQPTALVVANEIFRAVETIGYPEAAINLAHGAVYLATCKKDRTAYDGYFAALDDVKKLGNLPVPLGVRNAPAKLMKELGYGSGYEPYSKESFLPKELQKKKYWQMKVRKEKEE